MASLSKRGPKVAAPKLPAVDINTRKLIVELAN